MKAFLDFFERHHATEQGSCPAAPAQLAHQMVYPGSVPHHAPRLGGVSAGMDKKGRTSMVNNRLRQKAGPCRDESSSIPWVIWDANSAKSCQMPENDQMSRIVPNRFPKVAHSLKAGHDESKTVDRLRQIFPERGEQEGHGLRARGG
jgi:hypothetical protein